MGCEPSKEKSGEPIQLEEKRNNKNYGIKYGLPNSDIISQNVTCIEAIPQTEDLEILEKALCDHFFFYRLKKNQRFHLIKSLEAYSAQKGNIIFQKGDNPNLFFFIKSGSVSVQIQDGQQSKILGPSDYFGQLALLYKAPRSATIRAMQDCVFFGLSHQIFRKTMQEITIRNFSNVKQHIQKASIFNYLTNREKVAIAYNTHTLKYEKNDTIFQKGDDANSFYIIMKGKIKIEIAGKDDIYMIAGQSFGENCFQKGSIRSGTAKAVQKTSILSIGRDSLKKCIGGYLEEMSFINIMKWSMSRHKFLKCLSDLQRRKLISIAQIRQYENNEIIQEAQSVASKFYICLEQKINQQGVGHVHNFQEILAESFNVVQKSLTKIGKGKVAIFQYQKVKKMFGKSFLSIFQSNMTVDQALEKKKRYIQNIELNKLTVKFLLGQGLFGKVYCVEDNFKMEYALKCINRQKVIQNQMEKFIILEKKVLEEIDSPFIVKLVKTFSDSKFVFFLLEYIDGGDFFKVLRNIGICSDSKAQFYFGCLVLAIEHLHKKNIIYRDIKPENTVVDKAGFLHLVDLGTAKYLDQESGYRTFTIIGTPHYMAPQIIQGQGYSFSVDLWSMGVFLYEMLFGQLPFGNQIDNPYQVFKQIEETKALKIPSNYKNIGGIDLIEKLLSRDQRERSFEDFSQIKSMKFFQDFCWQSLEKKKMDSPYTINRQKLNIKINKPLVDYLQQIKFQMPELAEDEKKITRSMNDQWLRLFPQVKYQQ